MPVKPENDQCLAADSATHGGGHAHAGKKFLAVVN